jgi:hypothetical protein
MELKRLNASDEDIGRMLFAYIQTSVERVMTELIDKGFTEEEVLNNQDIIEHIVINEAGEALGYYFEGETMDNIVSDVIRNLKI